MRISRISVILAGVAVAAILLPAQAPPKGTTGGTTGVPPTGTTGAPSTGNVPGNVNPPNPNSTTNPGLNQRGEFFFGKVVMPDGTVPPSGVIIERVCNGSAHPQAYTDSRGDFSFQVGQTQDMLPDASVDSVSRRGDMSGATNNQQDGQKTAGSLYNCDLRASLAGYRSDTISLAGRRNLDDPNVGTIMLHSNANYEGLTTSATSALAPKDAHKAFENGLQAMKKSKIDEAQTDFLKATELYPRYASAWYELGLVYERRERVPDARDAYAKAIAADSKYVNPYERLYMLAFDEKDWVKVAQITNQVMHLNPYDFPGSLYFNAVANSQLGKLDIAEKSAREAVQLSATRPNPSAPT
jgi:hypothetical protein